MVKVKNINENYPIYIFIFIIILVIIFFIVNKDIFENFTVTQETQKPIERLNTAVNKTINLFKNMFKK